MSRYESFTRASIRVAIILLIVTVPAAIYAFVVVRDQLASATALNLRTVSEIGSTIDDRIEALRQIVNSLPPQRTDVPAGERRASVGCTPGRTPYYCTRNFDPSTQSGEMVQQFRTNEWFKNLADTTSPTDTCDRNGNPRAVVALDPSRGRVISAVRCLRPDAPQEKAAETYRHVRFEVPLMDLVPRRTFDSPLDGIIVADCGGDVLYADTRREFSVQNIAEFGAPDAPPDSAEKTDGAKATPTQVCRGRNQSWVARRELGGRAVMIFGHPYWPLNMSPPQTNTADGGGAGGARADENPTWYLIGVQEERAFRRAAQVLPFELVVIISPLIVFAILAWPFLLIALAAKHAKFGRGVPLAFVASLLIGAGLLSALAVGLAGHYWNAGHRDGLLRTVAAEVADELGTELRESLAILTTPSADTFALVDKGNVLAQAIDICDTLGQLGLGTDPSVNQRCHARFPADKGAELVTEASRFEFAFQMDSKGEHVGPHLSLRDASSSRRALPERAYFQRALKDQLWPALERDGQPFFIEPIRSKDFGWALASFSASATGSAGKGAMPGTAVVVMIKRLQALFEPVLPLGVGLAVVKDNDGSASLDGSAWRAGDVLFHSVESRALIENILTETDNDPELALALTERRAAFLDVNYRGAAHRFYTRPLREVPWTLVVTYEKEVLRMFTWRLILTSAAAFLSYLVVFVVTTLIVQRRRSLPAWLQPTPKNVTLHRDGAITLAMVVGLLFVAGVYAAGTTSRPATLWGLLIGSFFAVYGLLVARFEGERAPAAESRRHVWKLLRAARKTVARYNRAGSSLLGLGLLVIVVSQVFAGAFNVWAWLLLLVFLAAFVFPQLAFPAKTTQASDRKTPTDRPFVTFVLVLLAAVSAVPAILLSVDSHAYHREAYEKANLGHVADRMLSREAALKNEARRLQPSTFDRAGVPPFAPTNAAWCRGFFGFGVLAPFKECNDALLDGESTRNPPTVEVKSLPAETDEEMDEGTRFRSATSWFATVLPAAGTQALLFAEGWRNARDGDSLRWGETTVTTLERPDALAEERNAIAADVPRRDDTKLLFATSTTGLFDLNRGGTGRDTGADAALVTLLVVGVLIVLHLGWRSVKRVTRTFFGLPQWRVDQAAPHRGDWSRCTPEERNILRNLAEGHLVNADNEESMQRLVDDGLVALAPEPQIADELAAEIRSTPRNATERKFAETHGPGTWEKIRAPFFAVIGISVIAILVAAPDALRSVMGILAASAGGVGVIVQIMSFMVRNKT